MRESVGGSLLFNIVIIFTSIVILVFVSIMAFSKAYRVKNRIVEVVEKYGTYDTSTENYLNEELRKIGYKTTSNKSCSYSNVNNSSYDYCIYRLDNANDGGYYYKVVTYATFQFPIVGDFLKFKVEGETRIMGKSYNY